MVRRRGWLIDYFSDARKLPSIYKVTNACAEAAIRGGL